MSDLVELVFQQLKRDLAALNAKVDRSILLTERSEQAGGVQSLAFADIPTDGIGAGDMLWISDGRKTGEGTGAGTGVLVYYNPATLSWKRISDDVDVSV